MGIAGTALMIKVMKKNPIKPKRCYNGSLPLLFTTCDPGKSSYCSLRGPEYGCTTDPDQACTKFHLCNTPEWFLLAASVLVLAAVLTLLTGCLWCCCCCCCGRCCRGTCTCFARMYHPSHQIYPMVPPNWNMYQGLESVKQRPEEYSPRPQAPSAPPPFD